jgi:hypothetical protein
MPINVTELANKASSAISSATASIQANISAITANISAITANIAAATANLTSSLSSNTSSSNSNLGPAQAQKTTFTQGADRAILTIEKTPTALPLPKVKTSIPTLLQNDVKALMLQIAYMESNVDETYLAPPRSGRYAVHDKTLVNYGYKNPNTGDYLGKDGIKSEIDFIYDTVVQDRIMERFLLDQYKALIKIGAIKENDTREVIGGMLAVAYQFQDASPGAGTLSSLSGVATGADTAGLVSTATSLSSSLSASLATNSGIDASMVDSLSQPFDSALQGLMNTNPVNSKTDFKNGLGSLKAKSQNLKDTATAAAASTKASLEASAPGLESQLKQAAAKIDIEKLKSTASDFASSLPANKAKEWRQTGVGKDSLGREGTLFYNAGRYAIVTIAADVVVQPQSGTTQG